MTKNTNEEYDWLNDPFDEKKIAEEREGMGMSGASKGIIGVGCLLVVIGCIPFLLVLYLLICWDGYRP